VRVACRQASETYGLDVVAAAGNYGPKMTTITIPACEPDVIAVGAIETLGELVIWDQSSRGPTEQGETKPDFVMWGTDIEMASNKADDQYITKTGTSFAAPMLSGLTGLLWRAAGGLMAKSWPFRWTEARQVAQSFCTKPQEAPVNKDNSYGYGLAGDGLNAGTNDPINSPLQDTMQVFSPMIGIALMAEC